MATTPPAPERLDGGIVRPFRRRIRRSSRTLPNLLEFGREKVSFWVAHRLDKFNLFLWNFVQGDKPWWFPQLARGRGANRRSRNVGFDGHPPGSRNVGVNGRPPSPRSRNVGFDVGMR